MVKLSPPNPAAMKKISFSISDLICCGDEKIITTKLKVNPHIVDAVVNFANNLATITYHEEYLSEKQIKNMIADCGFHGSRTPPLLSGKEALAIADHKIDYLVKKGGEKIMKLEKNVLANAFALTTAILWTLCVLFVVLLPDFSTIIIKWWLHGMDITALGPWRLDLANFLLGGLALVISAWISGYIFGWAWEKVS